MPKTRFFLEVQPIIPPELSRLEDLASNLIYSWDRQIRGLFFRLDRELWEQCGHNPKLFLRRIDQSKLETAVQDQVYMQDYAKVVSSVDAYLNRQINRKLSHYIDQHTELISYSCAEFGLHESLPIYSGGLGILAGDHCKSASDLGLPLVATGILYSQGFFQQQIDGDGNQVVSYRTNDFADLPVTPVLGEDGRQLTVAIELPGREVALQLWSVQVGHITLYLLDSNLPANAEADRRITRQLYGGDNVNRLCQEMVLGIGGVRALRLLKLAPTVWHINEGHAAFQILERCRELVADRALDFETALEAVAANTVFTTHTPVPAGHDIFDRKLMSEYFKNLVHDLGINMERFLELGRTPNVDGFNMTALAMRGSRFHNGVSEIHGNVAAGMESFIWPEVPREYNPITWVTNGVHVQTFLASDWVNFFDANFGGGWRNEIQNVDFWSVIRSIRNHNFWSLRESLKARMLESVRERYTLQLRRNGVSESGIKRKTRFIDPTKTDILTVGFARRFATYKRATLLFSDIERLASIISHRETPVVFIFAGKAHPSDQPAQDLIRRLHHISEDPRFEGRVILLEDYDIALSRKLVTGVDVWLNNPIHPLEASGTSGQKAAMNGVLNLSVLDGWWAEGFNGKNGWGITAHGEHYDPEFRDREENRELLEILESEVIPKYYKRNGQGYSEEWIAMSKEAMETLIPRYSAERMLSDYMKQLYAPAGQHGLALSNKDFKNALALAEWKQRVRQEWPQVTIELQDCPALRVMRNQQFELNLVVHLGDLKPEDVKIECLLGYEESMHSSSFELALELGFIEQGDDGTYLFRLQEPVQLAGHHCYVVRIFPWHKHLAHQFETGLLKWL